MYNNHIGNEGCIAISDLKFIPNLGILKLDLSRNQINENGLIGFHDLSMAKNLTTFVLDLGILNNTTKSYKSVCSKLLKKHKYFSISMIFMEDSSDDNNED